MNAFESNVVERELLSLFSSNYVEAKIKDALKSGQSEFNQKLLLGVQDIANAVVEDFKKQLRAELQAATNDWIAVQNALEIVPNGTKYLGSLGNGKVCVVEYTPTLKTLDFKTNQVGDCGGVGKFRIAFPYVVFIIRLVNSADYAGKLIPQTVYVGCRTKPLQSLDDTIHRMPLPNCDGDYHICMGSAWSYIAQEMLERRQKYSLSEMVEAIVGYFWNSGFNNDLCDTFCSFTRRNPTAQNLKTWQDNSAKDPLFILKADWGGTASISRFLDRNVGEPAKLNTGRIVDRVLMQASQRLTDYLRMASQVTISSQKASDIMKNALYESMTTTCGRVLDSARNKIESDASSKVSEEKRKLQLELEKAKRVAPAVQAEPDRIKRYQNGDYLYHPPTVDVW